MTERKIYKTAYSKQKYMHTFNQLDHKPDADNDAAYSLSPLPNVKDSTQSTAMLPHHHWPLLPAPVTPTLKATMVYGNLGLPASPVKSPRLAQ